jgi:hypothetical protein
MHDATVDNEVLRLHRQGFVTGAIAIRLGVESSYVRNVVRTHLKAVAQSSKPQYSSKAEQRRKAEARVTKAQAALERAAAELQELNGS